MRFGRQAGAWREGAARDTAPPRAGRAAVAWLGIAGMPWVRASGSKRIGAAPPAPGAPPELGRRSSPSPGSETFGAVGPAASGQARAQPPRGGVAHPGEYHAAGQEANPARAPTATAGRIRRRSWALTAAAAASAAGAAGAAATSAGAPLEPASAAASKTPPARRFSDNWRTLACSLAVRASSACRLRIR